MSNIWIFGYGSLMWRPGFETVNIMPATIYGLHRSLCVYSWVHRGTKERPGLVFGLDTGGACKGMAFEVAGHNREDVLTYLRERELVTNAYLEVVRPIKLQNGETTLAVTYVVDQAHPQYAGHLPLGELSRHVHGAVGQSGGNEEYILNTVSHLRELAIHDSRLELLADRLRNI
jgi:cation transport protein ChaC